MVVSSALIISGCGWGSDRFALLPRFSGHFLAEDGGYFALHKSPRDVGARQRAVLSARAVNLHQRKISARLVAWFAWEMAAEASRAAVDVRLRPCLPLGAIYGGGGEFMEQLHSNRHGSNGTPPGGRSIKFQWRNDGKGRRNDGAFEATRVKRSVSNR